MGVTLFLKYPPIVLSLVYKPIIFSCFSFLILDFGSKMAQAAAKVGAKPAKPVFNAEGKMVFSKFDFTDDRGFKTDDPRYIFTSIVTKFAIVVVNILN